MKNQGEAEEPAGPPWAWRFAVAFVVQLLRRLRGWRVQATLPARPPAPGRPLVIVTNHTSNVDLFLVADTVWRRLQRWGRPLGKAELFDVPVVGAVGRAAGAIPVARADDASREMAYDAAISCLRGNGAIILAPEGTVTHDGTLLPLRHGAARMAIEAGADILVVTHAGAQRAFSPVASFPHRGVVVTMTMDLVEPWEQEDEVALTGRITATLLDRSLELAHSHPQADPTAPWWPPYVQPKEPTKTAAENLERYRHAAAEAVAHARERMAAMAEEHHVEERAAEARERARKAAERFRRS